MTKQTIATTNNRIDSLESKIDLILVSLQSQPTATTATTTKATATTTKATVTSPMLAKAMETNLYHSTIEKGANTIYFNIDRDWTWVIFDLKPCENTRNILKHYGFRYSRKRVAWYANTAYDESTMATLAKSMQTTATLKKWLPK